METILYRNINREDKVLLKAKLSRLQDQLPKGIQLHGYFRRSKKGIYTGSLQTISDRGETYSQIESKDLLSLYASLKKKTKKQIYKQKDRVKNTDISYELPEKLFKKKIFIPQLSEKKRTLPDYAEKKQPKVLIIDDDVDSLVLVDSVFRKLGCNTIYAIEPGEARRKMSNDQLDFIVLDWMVCHSTGGEIVRQCTDLLDRFAPRRKEQCSVRPKIITYSGLSNKAIELSDLSYFDHIDHWRKPILHPEITKRATNLLFESGL